uniref:twin-arginine translocation signal domain-containing protein n=1 Tax=Bacteroides uniformis TaxID=820 RepID=UPI003FEF4050
MEEHHKNNMNRRDFLKIVGITTATSTAALYGCGSKEGSSEGSKVLGPIPTDKMTYRSFPGLGSGHYKIFCVNVKYGIQYGFR